MRIRRALKLFACLLLCCATPMAAAGAQAPPAAATEGPTMTGSVSDEFFNPLGGIVVAAVHPVTEAVLASDSTLAGDGSFSFVVPRELMTAGFKIRFTDPSGVFTTEYHKDAPTLQEGSLFPPDTSWTQWLQFTRLGTALRGTLSGTVTNTAGAPLQGMTVRMYRHGDITSELTTTTGAGGFYAFTGLDVGAGTLCELRFSDPRGDYLRLDYDADPSTIFSPDAADVVAGQTTTADAVLRRSCTLSGVVTDSRTHLPVVGVDVWPALAPGQPAETDLYLVFAGTTDAAGAYTVTGIPDGVYVVACAGQPPVYGMQYWPAAATPETAATVSLTPASPTAVADVVLRHDGTRPVTTALNNVTMRTRNTARLRFRVSDAAGEQARLTLIVATPKGKVKDRVKLGVRQINLTDMVKWDPVGIAPGTYRWWITATDLAGNTQSRIVKKAMVLTR